MIHVGYEFEIDKSKPKQYGWDYLVAATAAMFPWLFCAGYFIWVLDMNSWIEALSTGEVFITYFSWRPLKVINDVVPVHIEVLLPAFVLGCMLARPAGHNPHIDDSRPGHQEGPEESDEQHVSTIVAACFMVFVGLSMPQIPHDTINWVLIASHVVLVTILSNLGKMFPFFCYRRGATIRERLALSIAMFPRGEVGAGVLVVSMGYGLGGTALTVAVLSVALNLLLTGLFIIAVKKLIGGNL